jgi:hypothetical protein
MVGFCVCPADVVLNVDENRLETGHALQSWPVPERPALIVTHPRGPGRGRGADLARAAELGSHRFDASHVAAARSLCPQASVQLVGGQRLSWYGSRTAHGLRCARDPADARD